MKKSHRTLAVILIAVLSISFMALLYFVPSDSLMPRSVLAISNVSIAPQGYADEATNEWKDSFWTILATTDMSESYNMIKFDSGTTQGKDQIGNNTVTPESSIQIKIVPQQPYYERPLDKKSYNVYPETRTCVVPTNLRSHSTSDEATAGRLDANIYTWGSQGWTKHTPFRVEVYKNGALIASGDYDNVGAPQTVTLRNKNNNAEWIALTDIGKIGTGYEIAVPDIMMFSGDGIFRYDTNLLNDVKYNAVPTAYSYYWFGGGNYPVRSNPGNVLASPQLAADGSPGLYISQIGTYPNYGVYYTPVADGQRPGIYRADTGSEYKAKPRAGSIFTDQSGLGFGGYSLVGYLKNMRGYSTISDLDVWNFGWTITGANHAKINLPDSSMSSLITIQISTELADAIVYQPNVANVKIESLSWQGSDQIGDRDNLVIKLKQESTATDPSTATVTIEDLNDNELDMNPPSFGVTLAAGETKTVISECLNTGADVEVSGKLRVTVTNRLGTPTSTKEIDYTLMPKGVGSTTLDVYAVNAENEEPIPGLTVAISYGTAYATRVTGNGGKFTIDLEGYQGSVSLSSAETTEYQAASTTKDVALGLNSAFLRVNPIGYSPEEPWWVTYWWAIVGIVFAVIIIVIVAYYAKKRHRRR